MLALVVRGEYFFQNAYAVTSSEQYLWSFRSIPLSAGFEVRPWRNRLWITTLSLYGTVSPGTTFSSQALDYDSPNTTLYTGLAYGGIVKAGFAVNPVDWFLVSLEAGVRYQTTAKLSASTEGNGSDFLKVNSALPTMTLRTIAFMAGLTVGFQF
jgi:hypothetical protein